MALTGKVEHDLRSSGVVVQVLGDVVHLAATCTQVSASSAWGINAEMVELLFTGLIVADDEPARLLVVVLRRRTVEKESTARIRTSLVVPATGGYLDLPQRLQLQ
jgi:hypothetical protein